MWKVLTGRRDGTVSLASEALANIPSPFLNFTALQQNFANKGLSVRDLVVLSGTVISLLALMGKSCSQKNSRSNPKVGLYTWITIAVSK